MTGIAKNTKPACPQALARAAYPSTASSTLTIKLFRTVDAKAVASLVVFRTPGPSNPSRGNTWDLNAARSIDIE